MPDLVGNLEDRFFRVAAQLILQYISSYGVPTYFRPNNTIGEILFDSPLNCKAIIKTWSASKPTICSVM